GYHATFGERNPEVSSLAMPVFHDGRVLSGSLAVVGPRPPASTRPLWLGISITSGQRPQCSAMPWAERQFDGRAVRCFCSCLGSTWSRKSGGSVRLALEVRDSSGSVATTLCRSREGAHPASSSPAGCWG